MAAEFRLLGDIDVRVGDRAVAIGHARQQAVLAVLLVEANRSVSTDQLVDRVWANDRLPNDPTSAVRTYVSLLRRALGAAGGAAIARHSSGYRLSVDAAAVDLHLFAGLVRQGREASDDATATAAFERALALWRGEPFAGLDGPWFRTVRSGLVEARWTARLDLVDIRLRLGRHAAVVAELTDYAAERPLDERIAGQLMLALYRCGRQADALAEYQRIRRQLADELGADPGERLRALHRSLLTGDPELSPATAASSPAPAVPAQLPADVYAFAGRDAELSTLAGIVGEAGTAVVISAVSGTAGVGKTALAVHWAHRAAARFPDGQLYVNLRGYDPYQPMAAGDALAGFLRALGVPDAEIPLELDDRAARYRTEVAGRRMLILLDNAASVEQVRPLLPGSGTCTVLVTSRDSLAGLVSVHGARRLELDLLPPADAEALLRRLIGARAEEAPDAVAALAELCARLPLALRVAAELAAARPATTLAELVEELGDHQRRLDLLDTGGDPRAAVTTVFSWSVRRLEPAVARLFRLLGLHPGADVDAPAAAALAGVAPARARQGLETLARAHLVHPTAAGRYGMHDLMRAYAISLATTVDGDGDRRAALDRLFDHYLAASAAAMDSLYPAESYRRPRVDLPAPPGIDMSGADRARRWLDAERPTLVAACAHAARHGWPGHVLRLSATLARYLDGGHFTDAASIHGHALDAARQAGDEIGLARSLAFLGSTYLEMGGYEAATAHLTEAGRLFDRAGDLGGEGYVELNLARIDLRRGAYGAATAHIERGLLLSRRAGDPIGEARALVVVGIIHKRQGDLPTAVRHSEQALELFRRAGDKHGEASTLCNLGLVQERTDRLEAALTLFRELGDVSGEASTLDNLGILCLGLGRARVAVEHFARALALYRRMGDKEGQAWALNGLGEAAHAIGRTTEAVAHHTEALAIATALGDVDQQARARAGLGTRVPA